MILSMVGGCGGVEVQTKSGSGRTNSSGQLTINCGFKPDLLVFYLPVYDNYEPILALPLKEQATNYPAYNVIYDADHILDVSTVRVSDTGATVLFLAYDWNWEETIYSNQTINWRAIKYSE